MRPPPRSDKTTPPVIPRAFSRLNQTSPYSTFVEAEDTSQVTYGGAGWSTLTCQYCSGAKYRRSNGTNNTATFTFNGSSVSVILVGNARSGIAAIKIDDVSYPSINLFNNAAGAEPDPQEYVIATNLPSGPHTLEVRVTGQDGYTYRLSTTQVGIDGFRYGNSPFGTLRGRVLDPDGDGIPGAWLNIVSGSDSYSVQAGSDGIFGLSGLPAATYTVTALAEHYTAQVKNGIVLANGGEVTGIDIKLPETSGHPLYGRIYLPHSNDPAIQQPGATLSINVKTGSNAAGWSASLSTTFNTVSLPIISASYDPITAWTIQATIPTGTPSELYDLTVSSSLGTDTQVRAVQVITQYRDPFYFVVLGDPQAATNEPGQPTLENIMDEINLINPAFVLVVGDLIENGSEAEFERYVKVINRLRVPSYAIAGNHDFADTVGSVGQIQPWGLWKKYFGRRYYSFDYGPYHIVGMDNTIIHTINPAVMDAGGYFADQAAWAQADLAAHQNSLARFLFLHLIRQPGATNPDLLEWKPPWIDGLHVNMVHYGHAGANDVQVSGNTPVHWVETDDAIEKVYRLVRINHGAIGSYTYQGSNKDAIPSENLNLNFSPDNDGEHNPVTATIKNPLQEHFEHALIRFVMPAAGCYVTNNGVISQIVPGSDDDETVVYVTLDVPAAAQTKITVSECIGPDLVLTQSTSANPVIAGNNLIYTLNITNNGPLPATGVTLTNTLPVSVTFVSTTPGNCDQSGGNVTCQLSNLAANSSAQVQLEVAVDPSARGTLTNLATVAADEYDPKGQNNNSTRATSINTEADLSIVQIALPNPVIAGDDLTYYLTVANNGPSTATGVTLSNTLPANLTFISTNSGGCQTVGQLITCNLGDLLPHTSTAVALQAMVDPATKQPFTNLAAVVGVEPDLEPANNTTQLEVTLTPTYQIYLPVLLNQK